MLTVNFSDQIQKEVYINRQKNINYLPLYLEINNNEEKLRLWLSQNKQFRFYLSRKVCFKNGNSVLQ